MVGLNVLEGFSILKVSVMRSGCIKLLEDMSVF